MAKAILFSKFAVEKFPILGRVVNRIYFGPMKKIIYTLLAVLGFGAVSCEEHGAEMPMYACPAPEYIPSDDVDGGRESSEEGEADRESL